MRIHVRCRADPATVLDGVRFQFPDNDFGSTVYQFWLDVGSGLGAPNRLKTIIVEILFGLTFLLRKSVHDE